MRRGRQRGTAMLLALLLVLLVELLLAGLGWALRAHARAGLEYLAAVRASAAADAALATTRAWLEATRPESLATALRTMPPPVRLPGGTTAYAEFDPVDSTLVEVVAQGFSGANGVGARRQRCLLLRLAVPNDSGATRVRAIPVPERAVTSC